MSSGGQKKRSLIALMFAPSLLISGVTQWNTCKWENISNNVNYHNNIHLEIKAALARAGIRKSNVSEYVSRDEYGVASRCKPRTEALRSELELLNNEYKVIDIWVNGLKEVIIEYRSIES